MKVYFNKQSYKRSSINNFDSTHNYSHPANKPGEKWFRPAVKYDHLLRVPALIARNRLEKAFTSPGIISKKLLHFQVKYVQYIGTITGNCFDASIHFLHGRVPVYHIQGESTEELQVARIKIKLEDRMPQLYFALLSLVVGIYKLSTQSIYEVPPVILLLGVFWFVARKFINKSSAISIGNVPDELISTKFHPRCHKFGAGT